MTSPGCELFVGTSGYSYGEWADAGFYPEGARAGDMLPFYTGVFNAVEINYTWYQMPKAAAIERMCGKAPPRFRFSVKLTRTMTHEVRPGQWQKETLLFRQGVEPLVRAGKLLSVLVQLPPYFTRTPARRQYLAALLDELSGLPVAVEFRHDSWACDKVFGELEQRHVTLVSVDAPDLPGLFPRLDRVTNPALFYIRFHGRNARGWRSGNMQHQFDYTYSDTELGEWAPRRIGRMAGRAERGGIFFNNHVRAQAPENATRWTALLLASGCFLKNRHGNLRHSPERR